MSRTVTLGYRPEVAPPWPICVGGLSAKDDWQSDLSKSEYQRLRIAEMQIPHSTHRALPARGCPQAYWIVAPDVRIDVFNSPRLQGLKDEVSYSPVNSTSAVLRFRVAVVHIGLLWRWSRMHAEF